MKEMGSKSANPKKSRSLAEPKFQEFIINVLGYQEEGQWCALALEMDLRGYGKTFEAAMKELCELVIMQISFAFYKKQPEMIWKPADPVWLERFGQIKQEHFLSMFEGRPDPNYRVGNLPIPEPHVIAELAKTYTPANA